MVGDDKSGSANEEDGGGAENMIHVGRTGILGVYIDT